MKKVYVPFEEALKSFSPEELAWDYHCDNDYDAKRIIAAEARSRGIDICRVPQVRHGGPFVPGMKYTRPACNGKCGLKERSSG